MLRDKRYRLSSLGTDAVTSLRFTTLVIVVLIMLPSIPLFVPPVRSSLLLFDGDSAFEYLDKQCAFGPRPPGSTNLSQCRSFIVSTLRESGWSVHLQNFTYRGTNCANIIATYGSENATTILGAHYDTRPVADRDPDPANRTRPILGANDGASGSAVLLELARVLPAEIRTDIELVFFDAEDSGGVDGWDWIVGSNYYVTTLDDQRRQSVRAMILLDMVGDASLILRHEQRSTVALQNMVWSIASDLGYGHIFVNETGAAIIDDHNPFIDAGIPALDIIHHAPFPWYWHTLEDTPDRCSASSLEVVGRVLEEFLLQFSGSSITFTQGSPTLSSLVVFLLPPVLIMVAVSTWWLRREH